MTDKTKFPKMGRWGVVKIRRKNPFSSLYHSSPLALTVQCVALCMPACDPVVNPGRGWLASTKTFSLNSIKKRQPHNHTMTITLWRGTPHPPHPHLRRTTVSSLLQPLPLKSAVKQRPPDCPLDGFDNILATATDVDFGGWKYNNQPNGGGCK